MIRMVVNVNLDDEPYYIILDACRYDIFSKIINEFNIKGTLYKGKSVGNNTTEFYDKINEQKDMIVTTANAHPKKVRKKFKYVILTKDIIPGNNIQEFLSSIQKYPTFRHLLHIVQPHIPWVTNKGKELYDNYMKQNDIRYTINKFDRWFGPMGIESFIYKHYGRKTSLECYEDNLRYALKAIETNINKLPLRFIITSDHGNMFGEYGMWGHTDISHPYDELRNVPWFIIDRYIHG